MSSVWRGVVECVAWGGRVCGVGWSSVWRPPIPGLLWWRGVVECVALSGRVDCNNILSAPYVAGVAAFLMATIAVESAPVVTEAPEDLTAERFQEIRQWYTNAIAGLHQQQGLSGFQALKAAQEEANEGDEEAPDHMTADRNAATTRHSEWLTILIGHQQNAVSQAG